MTTSPKLAAIAKEKMTFVELLKASREASGLTQQAFAAALGYSAQHLCDLEQGRRMPSVKFVKRICQYKGRGPKGRLEWYTAGARAQGWEV